MGVRFLNKYLKNNCHHAINEKNFSYFSNKIIAVDASIYIYKYLKTNNLLEGIYSMIIAFKKHNIKPIFVFDGKSIEQKNDLILARKEKKEKARKEYNKLLEQYNYLTNSYTNVNVNVNTNTHNENIDILVEKMNILKKECIQLKREDVTNIKELLTEFQIQYLDAENEADTLCVQLVKNNIAYACLSEDMDMFVYGCPRVLRYISVTHEKMVLYDFKKILTILKMNEEIFQIICILSGTDYNDYVDNHESCQCINKVLYYMESYKLYKKQLYPHSHPKKIIINDFENWLFNLPPKTILNTNDNCDLYYRTNYQTIKDIFQMKDIEFKFHKHTFYPSDKNMVHKKTKKINKKNIEDIMKKENFFFII
jgi:5'-3' exonuclease